MSSPLVPGATADLRLVAGRVAARQGVPVLVALADERPQSPHPRVADSARMDGVDLAHRVRGIRDGVPPRRDFDIGLVRTLLAVAGLDLLAAEGSVANR